MNNISNFTFKGGGKLGTDRGKMVIWHCGAGWLIYLLSTGMVDKTLWKEHYFVNEMVLNRHIETLHWALLSVVFGAFTGNVPKILTKEC